MIMRNGKAAAGWRLDEITEGGPVGVGMLMNPFAIVPKEENADRIVKAFGLLYEWLQVQPAVPSDFRSRVEEVLGKE